MQLAEPFLDILVQPQQHGHRFRYLKRESRSAVSLVGEGSLSEQNVYPTVQVDFAFHTFESLSFIIIPQCIARWTWTLKITEVTPFVSIVLLVCIVHMQAYNEGETEKATQMHTVKQRKKGNYI